MTSVRTEWHLAELSASEDDPFQGIGYSAGVTLDLSAPEAELAQQYYGLLRRERRMAATGLRCQLKRDGQDCLTCSAATLDPKEDRSRLCRVGKDEAALEAVIEERMDAGSSSLRELIELVDSASELGAIPDDLAELLTEVGL